MTKDILTVEYALDITQDQEKALKGSYKSCVAIYNYFVDMYNLGDKSFDQGKASKTLTQLRKDHKDLRDYARSPQISIINKFVRDSNSASKAGLGSMERLPKVSDVSLKYNNSSGLSINNGVLYLPKGLAIAIKDYEDWEDLDHQGYNIEQRGNDWFLKVHYSDPTRESEFPDHSANIKSSGKVQEILPPKIKTTPQEGLLPVHPINTTRADVSRYDHSENCNYYSILEEFLVESNANLDYNLEIAYERLVNRGMLLNSFPISSEGPHLKAYGILKALKDPQAMVNSNLVWVEITGSLLNLVCALYEVRDSYKKFVSTLSGQSSNSTTKAQNTLDNLEHDCESMYKILQLCENMGGDRH